MEKKVGDVEIFKALVSEHDIITQEIRAHESKNQGLLVLALTLLGSAYVAAYQWNINSIFLFLPVGVFWVGFNSLYLFSAIKQAGGYKRYLEDEINFASGKKIFMWEEMIVSKWHGNSINLLLTMINVLILSLVMCQSLRKILSVYGGDVFIWYVIGILVLTLLFLWGLRKHVSIHSDTYDFLKNNKNK